jgi:hypothetical protein
VSVSTDSSTPVDYLLRELARVKAENRRLREQARRLTAQRDRWRAEARAWKWGALSGDRVPLSEAERIEAQG